MAQTPTLEENAQKILSIYRHFDSKVGDTLRANNFIAVGRRNHWDMSDLQKGLDFAVDSGWLQETPTGWLALTKVGYSRM